MFTLAYHLFHTPTLVRCQGWAGVANVAARDLVGGGGMARPARAAGIFGAAVEQRCAAAGTAIDAVALVIDIFAGEGAFGAAFPQHMMGHRVERGAGSGGPGIGHDGGPLGRSEEHTSELQSLMRISYAVFCLKKKKKKKQLNQTTNIKTITHPYTKYEQLLT